ncbi:SDR family oxidoreductase [Rhizobium sp. BK060]|uniref:SDR family NAD(P)-dependent oxidoreductase n=1 Tax=Rhizobium sp. BK060 TaxID=2587096 RepID=UPI001610882A|nr:SDR family oxidoreductase [Rhizobium sp. BK060]MBB3396012.1 NAD(P)-dependent dehydrogenase (short-subunit alcohol dehydrogenase family) [Rhizobium sp. BK060]
MKHPSLFDLEGSVAYITGAADGPKASLGATFARSLAAAGAQVGLVDINSCASVVDQINASGGKAVAVCADVSSEEEVARAFNELRAAIGQPTILVNNAAVGSNIPPVPVSALAEWTWDQAMNVNVRGSFLCSKVASGLMAEAGYGKIVNIGSTVSRQGLDQRLHYVVAKGAIEAMTRALAKELGKDGIRVNTLAPGFVMSRAVERAMSERPGLHKQVLEARSIQRDISAEDLIGTLLFLCSRASDPITGQYFSLDNGSFFT